MMFENSFQLEHDNLSVNGRACITGICRMVMSSPPHPLMHFGMAGWLKIKDEETAYYKPTKPEKSPEWPPKYWKFVLETGEEPKCEAAFVDLRRFGRIRLIDCAADEIRNVSPLVENGPDPIVDKDILTEVWLAEKLGSKRVPVKALLLGYLSFPIHHSPFHLALGAGDLFRLLKHGL